MNSAILGILLLEAFLLSFELLNKRRKLSRLQKMSDYIVELDDSTRFIDHAEESYLWKLITFESIHSGEENWLAASYKISRKNIESLEEGLSGEHPCILFNMDHPGYATGVHISDFKNHFQIQELALIFIKEKNKLYLLLKNDLVYCHSRSIESRTCNYDNNSNLYMYKGTIPDIIDEIDDAEIIITDISKITRPDIPNIINLMGYFLIEDTSFFNTYKNSLIKLPPRRNQFYECIDKLKASNLIKRHIINCEGIIRD